MDADEPSYKSIFCQSCGTEITSTQNIAAERFQGRLGAATLYKTAINVTVMNTQTRELLSGVYEVADVTCRSCSKVVGWYYYQVTNKNNEWKIGKYCLEDQLANSKRVYKPVIERTPERTSVVKQPERTQSAVSSMMTMMSPAAVVNAVVRSSSKMMSASLDDEDDDDDDDDENERNEAESESSDEDDVSVGSVKDDVVDDDDSDGEEESDQEALEDVDEWEVVELIEMPA